MQRRWDLLVFAAILAAPLVFGLLVLGARRASPADHTALVDRVLAQASRTYPRDLHAGPAQPGSFGDALAPVLDGLHESQERLGEDERELWNMLAAGGSVTTPNIEAELQATQEAVGALRNATRRKLGDPPHDLGHLGDPSHPWQAWGLDALQHGASSALIHGWRQLRDGAPAEALSTCLDVLAIGRDTALGTALLGRAISNGIQHTAAPLCAAALARVDTARRRQAAEALRTIRAGLPPWRDTIREESVNFQLLFLAQALSEEHRAALPERAQKLARTELDRPDRDAWLAAIVVPDAWREIVASHQDAEHAVELPSDARSAAFEAIADRSKRSVNPLPFIGHLHYERYVHRDEVVHEMLLALEEAARGEPGADLPSWTRSGTGWVYEMPPIRDEQPSVQLIFAPNADAQASNR